jgi:hypothetical protein
MSIQVWSQADNNIIEDSVLSSNKTTKINWDLSLAFKTMNVFRGINPSRAPVFSSQAGFKYNNFVIGFYGGSSTNGKYTETDLILMYYKPKFDLQVQWYYNFTEGVTHIKNPSGIFDFNTQTSIAMLDVIINKRIGNNLKFTSSTLLFGRDKIPVPNDIANEIPLLRGQQRYSQYLNLEYYKNIGDNKIEGHIGGSFSWSNFNGPTLYGSKAGFSDLGFSFSRKLIQGSKFNIPVKAAILINTVTNQIYVVASIYLIQLTKLK